MATGLDRGDKSRTILRPRFTPEVLSSLNSIKDCLECRALSPRPMNISIPPEHIRIQFYTHTRYAVANRPPCIQADTRLSESGDLEVQTVKDMFGLQKPYVYECNVKSVVPFYHLLEKLTFAICLYLSGTCVTEIAECSNNLYECIMWSNV
ncbi:hypothetical protein IW261DRAFT_1421371 [Armillaria novae-zelandiae]|uniref:Uncharacterized protein n=1 Tax=Armillaria novae-zelandiae TaxID=153914 RepID=A0AA39U854_9AGAR|nr:hypothetical protein IW261DRAFT_1421371 [Armillaria novae-zelandiae]